MTGVDGIFNYDIVIDKKIRLFFEEHVMIFCGEFYNLANPRDFGIPNATFSSAAFLNQRSINGGGRRISGRWEGWRRAAIQCAAHQIKL